MPDGPPRGVACSAPPRRGRLGGQVKRRSHNLQTSLLEWHNDAKASGLRVISSISPGWGYVMNL
jgi:hypothetical protein